MSFSGPPSSQLKPPGGSSDPSKFPYAGVPVDKGACRLLGPTALIVQALMGVLVIASLVYKRQREKPMRPWRIWLFDVSKQILGQAFVHALNLIISDFVAHLAENNPCDLYFLNVLIDTTIGVGYIYLVLHGADKLFTEHLKLKGFKSGQYGDPPSLIYWSRQASVYVFTILTMKLLVVGLFAAWPGIFDVGEWLLGWTDGNDRLQVIFVMGIFPIIMNILQFWLIDSIVKANASWSSNDLRAAAADESSREPLFRDNDSDDEDDHTIRAQRRHDIESPPTPQKPSSRNENLSESKLTASGSSSATIVESTSVELHGYPPDRSSSNAVSVSAVDLRITSPSSSTSSISSLRSKKSRRRSPPPPIQRPPPPDIGTQYTISVTPSPFASKSSHRPISSHLSRSAAKSQNQHLASQSHGALLAKGSMEPDAAQAWDHWADDDDWAEKVGEEDWSGRRLGLKKAALDVWGTAAQGASVEVS